MGLMLSGSVTGGVVFPLVAQSALPRFGFAWTVRIIGFVMLFNVAVILTLARTRIAPRRSGPFLELGAFKELPYTLFAISAFLILWPVYYAYDYVCGATCTHETCVHSGPSLYIDIIVADTHTDKHLCDEYHPRLLINQPYHPPHL